MLAYLSLLNLLYDLDSFPALYSEKVFHIEMMIFLACERLYFWRTQATAGNASVISSQVIVFPESSGI